MGEQFGGKITAENLKRYEASPQWREGSFQNILETKMDIGITKIPSILRKQSRGKKLGIPKQPLPILPFDKQNFLAQEEPTFIWYGHAVVLMRIAGKSILIDPMLGPDAAPIAPFKTKRFSENTLDLIDDFPPIDLVLMTHDHYDHLDLASIMKLKGKVKSWYVALGVKRHLESWGIPSQDVTEFDWWDEHPLDNLKIHFTPTRHFSGRGLRDRAKSLWGGWVIQTDKHQIWFSGDGGYGDHFKEIGERFKSFDFGFLECGQYSEDWVPIHMFPEEAIKAGKEAGVQVGMPFHWAGFYLSYGHTWKEPVEDFLKYASEHQLEVITPNLGQSFTLADRPLEKWWESLQ